MSVCLHQFCVYMNVGWDVCLFCVGLGSDEFLWGVFYSVWYTLSSMAFVILL